MRAPRGTTETDPTPPPAPTRAALHDAALRHLARYATTQAGMLRVLNRRIERWARATGAQAEDIAPLLALARAEVAKLAATGLLDDAAFATARARSLVRAGRSRRAVAAHLTQRGVDAETTHAALGEDPEAELAAALLLARKRRLGPFGPEDAGPADAATRHKALGALARAGFSQDVARRALTTDRAEAEQRIARLRQD